MVKKNASKQERLQQKKFEEGVTKRGLAKQQKNDLKEAKKTSTVAPIIVGLMLFMLVGGAFFGILMRAPPLKR